MISRYLEIYLVVDFNRHLHFREDQSNVPHVTQEFEIRTLDEESSDQEQSIKQEKDSIKQPKDSEKLFDCPLCSLSFSSRSKLHTHSLTHSDKKNTFTCKLCHKEFAFFCRLKAHINIEHLEVRRFSCSECDKTFKVSKFQAPNLKS